MSADLSGSDEDPRPGVADGPDARASEREAPDGTSPAYVRDPDRQVGFVLAGVQKAGTTTLFALLSAHPQVAHGGAKELHFFDNETVDWGAPDYATYNRRIKWTPAARIGGEATPRYLHWPGAMERLHAYNPDVRLLTVFRDPVERAFSHWAMLKERNPATLDFGPATRVWWATHWSRSPSDATKRTARTMISRGFYGQQLEHALTLFPRTQFCVLDYHRLFDDLTVSLGAVTDFLGLERFEPVPDVPRERATKQQLAALPPTGADVAALVDLYGPDLDLFARLSGLDISRWPTSRVRSGELPVDDLASALAARAGLVFPDEEALARSARREARRVRRRARRPPPDQL